MEGVTPSKAEVGVAASPRKRFRVRSCYFVVDDVVWVRPARLPYWPATVVYCDEAHSQVRARLLCPPDVAVLAANLREERTRHTRNAARHARELRAARQRRAAKAKAHGVAQGPSGDATVVEADDSMEDEPHRTAVDDAAPCADVVTSNAQRVYFFDRLATAHELQECIEERLQRCSHDVSAYEDAFVAAVHAANRLVRIVLSPERLQPYQICGVGVVHSLMRCHVAAPRQPHTSDFAPQTAVIRLRVGLENAVRDLEGFEYIWVLFQFSYSAAMASGAGQAALQRLAAHEGADASDVTRGSCEDGNAHTTPRDGNEAGDDAHVLSAWRRRQGATRSSGFKVMLVPPRDDTLRGVFATRSPHRPNFIGLSCVRLVAVHGLEVHIADHDLLHGTPVLDIKPYLPFCEAHPDARVGWVPPANASVKGKGDHKHAVQATRVDRVMDDATVDGS